MWHKASETHESMSTVEFRRHAGFHKGDIYKRSKTTISLSLQLLILTLMRFKLLKPASFEFGFLGRVAGDVQASE
jgi:hypothetical protein